MASVDDVYKQLEAANNALQQLHHDVVAETAATERVRTAITQGLTQVDNTLNTGVANLSQGMQILIELQTYVVQALAQNAKQNDTIICNQETQLRLTCDILNEVHLQTELQTSMNQNIATALDLYKTTHAAAALDWERREELRQKVLECCPPPKPKPFCEYEPCQVPNPLSEPPQTPRYEVFKPAGPRQPH